MMKNKHGFTLTEIMVTVIVVGLIAGFAVPNYSNGIKRNHERDAIAQLTALHATNKIFQAQNQSFFVGSGLSMDQVNTGLGINLIANGKTFSYTSDGATYTATFVLSGGSSFTARVTGADLKETGPGGNPCCSIGPCLALPGC